MFPIVHGERDGRHDFTRVLRQYSIGVAWRRSVGVHRQARRGTPGFPRRNAVTNMIALERRRNTYVRTSAPRRHVDRRQLSSRRSTVAVRLRVVRSDDVGRQLPGTRRWALPSASERVVSSGRLSPGRDGFAPHDSRGGTRSGGVADAARRGRSRGPDTHAEWIRPVSPQTDFAKDVRDW
jgi:hypothetical protein